MLSPRECRTFTSLAKLKLTRHACRGFEIEVHEHGVLLSSSGGDSLWLSRACFDNLLRWYETKQYIAIGRPTRANIL